MNLIALKDNMRSVDTSSLVDRVEANLVELLKERKLKVGDSIPKEIELAEESLKLEVFDELLLSHSIELPIGDLRGNGREQDQRGDHTQVRRLPDHRHDLSETFLRSPLRLSHSLFEIGLSMLPADVAKSDEDGVDTHARQQHRLYGQPL